MLNTHRHPKPPPPPQNFFPEGPAPRAAHERRSPLLRRPGAPSDQSAPEHPAFPGDARVRGEGWDGTRGSSALRERFFFLRENIQYCKVLDVSSDARPAASRVGTRGASARLRFPRPGRAAAAVGCRREEHGASRACRRRTRRTRRARRRRPPPPPLEGCPGRRPCQSPRTLRGQRDRWADGTPSSTKAPRPGKTDTPDSEHDEPTTAPTDAGTFGRSTPAARMARRGRWH